MAAAWSTRWGRSYAGLSHDRQRNADTVVLALIRREVTPGMRIKPIEPENFYGEARIDYGDRVIFRIESGTIWFVDVITNDDIGKYGKKIAGLF
jgi:hypothetical protein